MKKILFYFLPFLLMGFVTILAGCVLVSVFSRLPVLLIEGHWPSYSITNFLDDFNFSFFNGVVFGTLMFFVNLFLKMKKYKS
ncbi:hypothetical protein WP5S18E01_34300 [Enterobacter cloacae]|nr:hypothetical protein WP5S18E01_34300 [Enterobacter cloacae]